MTLTKCPSKGRRVSFRAAVMVVLALAAFGATNVATAANQIPPGEGGGGGSCANPWQCWLCGVRCQVNNPLNCWEVCEPAGYSASCGCTFPPPGYWCEASGECTYTG